MDYDVYELSERERQVVFTALDLYREAAEKQQEANEKKLRVHSEEIDEVLEILTGDDYRIGLIHKFMTREARERIAKERAERERRDREARAQMGLFSEGGGQTVEEALEGIEEEAKRKIADAEVSKQHGDQVEPAAAALDPDVERALKQALDGIDALLPHEDVQIGEDGGEPIIETRIAPVSDEDLTAALRGLWKGTVEKGMAISFRHYRTLSGAETHVFVVGGSFAPAFYFGVDREVHGFTKWEPTLAGAALLDAVRHVWGIPRPEAVDVQEATTEATDPEAEAAEPAADEASAGDDKTRVYEALLSTFCPDCRAEAGQICMTIGGNPRNGFHSRRIRAAIKAGSIRREDYEIAYQLETNEDPAALDSAGIARRQLEIADGADHTDSGLAVVDVELQAFLADEADESEASAEAKPTSEEEHTIRSAAAHFFAGDEGAQRDYVAGAFDAIADRAVGDRLESHGQVSGAYVRGHSLGRTLLEKRKKAAAAAAPEQAAETSAPTTGADDAFAELVSALKGDSRPITDFAELLSPTLIAILRDHGITTVGHVAERWDELPGITGVGKVSLGRLRTLLQEASSAATAGAAASAGETDEDGDLPF